MEMSLPSGMAQHVNPCRLFFVEHPKIARALLIKLGLKEHLDDMELISMKNGISRQDYDLIYETLKRGEDIGIISDAGCPAVADPGFQIVSRAHRMGAEVIPFVGPSSILLGLMASGFNGQNFTFHGYLPKDIEKRKKKIRDLDKAAHRFNQTQIFIETPYRNQYLYKDLISMCQKNTKICLAVDLTTENQWIRTKSAEEWSKAKVDLSKKQCIFLLYK